MKVELIVYDFDGVMTDNKVYVDENGREMVQVNRSDGLGVEELKKMGYKQIIISTEKNPVVSARAEKLKIPFLQNIKNKKDSLNDYCNNNKINLKHVIFIGNDINDLEAMKIVGNAFCPSDSHKSIKLISNYIFNAKGGAGVIRELLDYINENY